MARLSKLPMFGEGIAGKSYVVTRQRRLNCYYELRPDGDKTDIAIYGTPGLTLKFSVNTPFNYPMRAMLGTQSGLYLVAYNQFASVSSAGSILYSSPIGTITGLASMAFNNTQVILVDGASGYIYASGVLTKITSAGFPNGAMTVTSLNGFFVCELPGTGQFYVSNALDGTTWNALAFATAYQYPDNLLAVDNLGGNLVLFSQTHMEFWQNTGQIPQPFQPILSATVETGLAAIFSRSHVNNTIVFLSQNPQGTVQVSMVQGTGVTVVSIPDLEYIINQFPIVSDAVSLSYVIDGHPMYQLTFPSAGRSFLFDASTNAWGEVQSGVATSYARHTGNLSTYYAGKTLISDYSNGNVYSFDPENYTDNGSTIVREVITRHATDNFNKLRISHAYLDMETGVGNQSGLGYNPQIMLQTSRDNGRTWGIERWKSLGQIGRYRTRVLWRRLGASRDMVFRLRMTDPVKFVIASGAIKSVVRE